MTTTEQLKRGEAAEQQVQAMLANERSLLVEIERLRKDFDVARTASHLFERASNDWMDRALKAESKLAKFTIT